jgi:hypothetical protein
MLPFMTTKTRKRKVATPWGAAAVVDEVTVRQRVDEREFAVVVELLEGAGGHRLARLAYTTDGVVRRGPVTLRGTDVRKLRKALAGHDELAALLDLGGGDRSA